MREIRFRGWHLPSKTRLTHDESLSILMLQGRVNNKKADDKGLLSKHIIEQYTGLKDKKGVDIYEGDIVKGKYTTDMGKISLIIWADSSFCVYGVGKNGHKSGFACCQSEATILEIIGNIHQNPELLR